VSDATIPIDGTVYAVLLNHRAAVDALGDAANEKPYGRPPVAPVLYVRPANTWSADGTTVALPAEIDAVEVEATFGIVFDRATSHVAVDDALAHVRGYVVVADLTVPHASVYRPAVRQRNRDGFCVIGSGVFDADLRDARVTTQVGDAIVASATTAGLLRDVPALIAEVSGFMRFDAGDVLLVGAIGTPVRVGRGDLILVEIEGLGAVSLAIAPTPETIVPSPPGGGTGRGRAQRATVARLAASPLPNPPPGGRERAARVASPGKVRSTTSPNTKAASFWPTAARSTRPNPSGCPLSHPPPAPAASTPSASTMPTTRRNSPSRPPTSRWSS